jgi:predicted ATP-dependent serine protease
MFRQLEKSAYPDLEVDHSTLAMVSGRPGMGKSSMAALLANGVKGPCLSVNAEEGIGPAAAARLRRLGIKRDDYHIITRASVDVAVSYARKVRARSMVIDSVQEASWSADELRHALEVVPEIGLLVAVMQVTKAGLPAGSNSLIHECDVHIVVEDMAWRLLKSRFQNISNVGGPVLPSHANFTGSKEER